MSKTKVNIFWFRRDLRLEDNVGLYQALQSDLPILPIFIFDVNILNTLPKDDARVHFIYDTLEQLNSRLKNDYKSGITIFHSSPLNSFETLTQRYDIDKVYTNNDYEPYAIQRDLEVSEFLNSKGITLKTFKDHVIFERNEIVKKDGTPYKVYTPYSKQWIKQLETNPIQDYPSETQLHQLYKYDSKTFPSLSLIGFVTSAIPIASYNTEDTLIGNYEATRNFPALEEGTSKVGPHLRFGTISIRKLVKKALAYKNNTYLKELIWREFFIQILWHYPQTITQSFKPQYDRIQWRNNKQEFKLWCQGQTGYPLVDAGMRELNATGNMHNRVRMVVGSFLCKHLLIDWRWGEAYFAKKLNDFELSSNVGNWQWVAGCGVDAAPYFRIFNPTTQIQKFDKEYQYIKKWVPEYQELTYPAPIVYHKMARERCLKTYKTALETNA
ncbi:cryptochrome/photolyase family protein [Pontimicrobium sp. IMCC45349]|uniref:cryptochrome/photolyase family protein n=1 Tax=Pontimicrobium sp. IMCC45349 TaxID=3391574 RepID=UPI0039A3BB24